MSIQTYKVYSGYGDSLGDIEQADRNADIDYLEKAFKSFDKDQSNYIDPQELTAALTMLGIKHLDGVEDADGDGRLSLKDLDADGDQKISFEEFKVLAAVLPKREHAIYKGALAQKPVVLPRDTSRATPVQRNRAAAQEKTNAALEEALKRLCARCGVPPADTHPHPSALTPFSVSTTVTINRRTGARVASRAASSFVPSRAAPAAIVDRASFAAAALG